MLRRWIVGTSLAAWACAGSTPDVVESPPVEETLPVELPVDVVPVEDPVVTPGTPPEEPVVVAPEPADPKASAPKTPKTPPTPVMPTPVVVEEPTPVTPTPSEPSAIEPAAPVDQPAVTYQLDPRKSWLYVYVRYDRGSIMNGHDHGIKARDFTGSVVWDPDDAGACKVDISFPVTTLVADPPGMRARLGLEGDTPEGDLRKIEENLRGKSQLDSSSFPKVTYRATSCNGTSGDVQVTGDLTIHGVSKRFTVKLAIQEGGGTFHAKGSFRATTQDFGFDPFVAPFGVLRNEAAMTFYLDVTGSP